MLLEPSDGVTNVGVGRQWRGTVLDCIGSVHRLVERRAGWLGEYEVERRRSDSGTADCWDANREKPPYRQAWPDYEVRSVTGRLPIRELPGKPWAGEPYGRQRLLLVVEQGFGDTLWVARYLARVKALGGELIMECQKELIPLIETLDVVDCLIPRGAAVPEAEYHCYLCSLPGLFTDGFASIPTTPVFAKPRDRVMKFKPLLDQADKRLKVGIVWSGSVTFKRNHERAQPLLRFFQAFALHGVQLFS